MSQTTAAASNPNFFAGYFNGNGNNQPPVPLMSTMAIPPPPLPPPSDSAQPPLPPPSVTNSVRLFIFFFAKKNILFSLKFRMVNSLFHLFLLLFQHYQNLIQVFHLHRYQFLKICIKLGLYNGHSFNKHNKLLLIKINFINHLLIHLQILFHHHPHRIISILNNKIII